MLGVSVGWDHRINYLHMLFATVPMLFDTCKYLLAYLNITYQTLLPTVTLLTDLIV